MTATTATIDTQVLNQDAIANNFEDFSILLNDIDDLESILMIEFEQGLPMELESFH